MPAKQKGTACAIGAYLAWGVLPVYWKLLQAVPARQILAHRIVWSLLFLLFLLLARRELRSLVPARKPRTLAIYVLASAVLALNWFLYIWAVNTGRIVETSFGYFINPLISVLLGVVFLRERLRLSQWLAMAIAAAGVAYIAWRHAGLPWIALVLACSFALYGLMKKTAPLPALPGLTLETALLWIPALAFLGFEEAHGRSAFLHAAWPLTLLLAFTGVVTALPLLLFSAAARSVPLSTLGLLQYLSPSCQLLIGLWAYGEPFDPGHAVGFGLIWTALAVYWVEGVWHNARSKPPGIVPSPARVPTQR